MKSFYSRLLWLCVILTCMFFLSSSKSFADENDYDVVIESAEGNVLRGGLFYSSQEGTRFYGFCNFSTGWVELNGAKYYFDHDGYLVTGQMSLGGMLYTFDENGVLLSIEQEGGFRTENGKTYYYINGEKHTGWLSVDGEWYFFGSDGVMYASKKKTISSVAYTFEEDGRLSGGVWKNTSKGLKYFHPSYENGYAVGWTEFGGNTYFFEENGVAVTGIKAIDGEIYSFSSDGILLKKCDDYSGFLKTHQGTEYYSNGTIQTGWQCIDDLWYFFDVKTGAMYTTSKTISGIVYQFDKNGVYQGGTFKSTASGTRYYDKGAYITGWKDINEKRYYFDINGYMLKSCCASIDGRDYVFDDQGVSNLQYIKSVTLSPEKIAVMEPDSFCVRAEVEFADGVNSEDAVYEWDVTFNGGYPYGSIKSVKKNEVMISGLMGMGWTYQYTVTVSLYGQSVSATGTAYVSWMDAEGDTVDVGNSYDLQRTLVEKNGVKEGRFTILEERSSDGEILPAGTLASVTDDILYTYQAGAVKILVEGIPEENYCAPKSREIIIIIHEP